MILRDTHVVVWLAFEPARLSRKARTAIDRARRSGEGLAICDITLLELTSLVRKGRIQLEMGLESFLREVETRFTVLPMSSRACARSQELPKSLPMDSADRIIAATALAEGLTLLTADGNIRKSQAVPTIW